jgi:uncharacterized membrane protein
MVRLPATCSIKQLCLTPMRQSFQLLFSSGFAGSLLTVRIAFSRDLTYRFLAWNLFLAWLPYVLSGLAAYAHRRRRWGMLLLLGGLWLLFFPNAPYILTDFLHLAPRGSIPVWYDVLLLAAFSWTGIMLALISLSTMQAIVKQHSGQVGGWIFASSTLVLGSLGVYLGRFLRWNSWDVFFSPTAVLVDVGGRLLHPLAHRQIYAVTILFSTFLFICYLTLIPARHREVA